MMGGNIAGGRIAGPQIALSAATLNQGRDLPVLTDYRGLLAEVVQRRCGVGGAQMDTIFPGIGPSRLGVACRSIQITKSSV